MDTQIKAISPERNNELVISFCLLFICFLLFTEQDGSIWCLEQGASTYLEGGGFGRESREADDIWEVDGDIIESLRQDRLPGYQLTGNWPRKRKSYKSIQSKANKNTHDTSNDINKRRKKNPKKCQEWRRASSRTTMDRKRVEAANGAHTTRLRDGNKTIRRRIVRIVSRTRYRREDFVFEGGV